MEIENTKRGENWNVIEIEEMLHCIKNKYISNLVNSKNRHNRKVYDKIALHMKKKGFNRKGFQVRIKFKNLKASYYKVKNSNDRIIGQRQTCEHFTLLDEILNGSTDANSGVVEGVAIEAPQTEEDTADEADELDAKEQSEFIDPLTFLASQSLKSVPNDTQKLSNSYENMESETSDNSENSENNKRRENWTDSEVEELLFCIKKNYITNLLYSKNRHNRKVFDKIAIHMKKKGFNRNWYQIRIKFKSLKADYYKVKNCNDKSIAQKHACEYFTLLDEIIGSKPDANKETGAETAIATGSGVGSSGAIDTLENDGATTNDTTLVDKKQQKFTDPTEFLCAKSLKDYPTNNQKLPDLIENVDCESSESNKRIEKWKDTEVEEMLYFIQKNYLTDLLNSKMKRNQKVFDKIALHLKKRGYNRNGFQVRVKFNVLRADYYKVKNLNDKSIGQRQTCEFYTLLDEMLGSQLDDNLNETEEPKVKNKKNSIDAPESSIRQMPNELLDNDQKLADLWLSKLRQMASSQKLYAEKFISDILFEGVLGNLNRNSVQINTTNITATTTRNFQQQNAAAQEFGRPLFSYGSSIKQEVANGTPGISCNTQTYQGE